MLQMSKILGDIKKIFGALILNHPVYRQCVESILVLNDLLTLSEGDAGKKLVH